MLKKNYNHIFQVCLGMFRYVQARQSFGCLFISLARILIDSSH